MAKATKKDKEITLETVLWNCRVALRGVGCKNRHSSPICTQFEHHFHALKPHLLYHSF